MNERGVLYSVKCVAFTRKIDANDFFLAPKTNVVLLFSLAKYRAEKAQLLNLAALFCMSLLMGGIENESKLIAPCHSPTDWGAKILIHCVLCTARQIFSGKK